MSHISGTLCLLPPSIVVIRFLTTSARHCYIPSFTKNLIKRVRSSHQTCAAKIGALRNFTKFTGKHLCQSLFFLIKLPWPATLLKKRLRHRYFLPNFVKFLRTLFLQNNSGRLLLKSQVYLMKVWQTYFLHSAFRSIWVKIPMKRLFIIF